MRRTAFLFKAFSALVMTVALHTAQAAIVAGKDYVVLRTPQPTETSDKVEVLEAFSYMCPHCYQFEPKFSAWTKTLPADVALRRLPISFNRGTWANMAQAYYALDAMGALDKLHGKVFDAIHSQKVELSTPDVMADWMEKQGVDKKKFLDTYNSFSVQSKTKQVPQMTALYEITSVPSIVVDGKYKITGASSLDDMFRIANELITLARSQRPAKASASPATPAPAKK